MEIPIHVVIVNFRAGALLYECLLTLLKTEVYSITVVDNNSGENEAPLLHEIAELDDRVAVLHSPENIGFGAGVNLGVRHANIGSDEFVWILNPDTTVDAGAPSALARAVSHGDGDIVSPVIFAGERPSQLIWFAGGKIDYRRGVSWHEGMGNSASLTMPAPILSEFITGAAPFMRKSDWDTLGGFREDYFLYWEDVDLSLRAASLGLRLAVVPSATIWHDQGGSTGQAGGGHSPLFYYFNQRNRLTVCGMEQSKFQLLFGTGIRETARLLLKPLILDTSPRGQKFIASVRGIIDGLKGVRGRGQY